MNKNLVRPLRCSYSRVLNLFLCMLLPFSFLQAQDRLQVSGYVYESNNKGYLEGVKITAKPDTGTLHYSALTDKEGKFDLFLPQGQKYTLFTAKRVFKEQQKSVDLTDTTASEPLFLKIPLDRLPGYLLEATITEFVKDPNDPEGSGAAFSLDGVTIEVYNNTIFQEELRLVEHPHHNFSILLEQGNEYIFMLRKEGYYTKRMRANVNVNGCILCMEGFGTVSPGVAESLTKNNTMGTLVANVAMRKMEVGLVVKMENIYYDYGSSNIRHSSYDALDQLVEMMRDNPRVVIELSSHTDCRGSNDVNKQLSQKRAESVVWYIRLKARLKGDRIIAKGYGEDRPVNSCVDGVYCPEELHQQNRRTEFIIIDLKPDDKYMQRSLASIMQEENELRMLEANNQSYFREGESDSTRAHREPAKPTVIPAYYSGFKIELMSILDSPDLNHPLFMEFDPVFLDLDAAGRISFLVGDFPTKKEAETYMSKKRSKYPYAKVVEYREGGRR